MRFLTFYHFIIKFGCSMDFSVWPSSFQICTVAVVSWKSRSFYTALSYPSLYNSIHVIYICNTLLWSIYIERLIEIETLWYYSYRYIKKKQVTSIWTYAQDDYIVTQALYVIFIIKCHEQIKLAVKPRGKRKCTVWPKSQIYKSILTISTNGKYFLDV